MSVYRKSLKELGARDGRVKLTEKDKELIIEGYITGTSKRKLAQAFNVCRKTIDNVLNPELPKKNYEQTKARGGTKIYYDKDKAREAAKKLREKKRALQIEEV